MAGIPADYQRLDGSERRPSPSAKLLGPADANEKVTVSIVLRRRLDGAPLPDADYFLDKTPAQRRRVPSDEFAAQYGASPAEIRQVSDFATSQGLAIEETNTARRTVVASGTVAQMSAAFAVELGSYEHDNIRSQSDTPQTETYRGRDGFIHIPKNLAGIIIGVFGLDNRRITKRNASGDPPGTTTITVPEVRKLYNFPTESAAGQSIGIFSEGGYLLSDVKAYYATLSGFTSPTITDVSVGAVNGGFADPETTQDICIASTAAPGASIAVYFTTYTQVGWFDLVERVAHPNAGDPVCSVLSSSFYVSDGDDAHTLLTRGISISWIEAVTMAFHDAALQGVTVCIASGDTGTESKVGDGRAHVQYPASDPWVLSVGGTTVGDVSGTTFSEYVWNDNWGATGGGISDYFKLPFFQKHTAIPPSMNDGHKGRGVPDVAANASGNSGYPIIVGGSPFVANGTSASAPLWAGLIAVINAAIGEDVGFVNPAIYALGSKHHQVLRDIYGPPGPANNGFAGVPGYPAVHGWDACTGWGSIDGKELLVGLKLLFGLERGEITKITGKIAGLIFDRFGDFDGFILDTEHGGERRFASREKEIEVLAERVWRERIRTTVVAEGEKHPRPLEIILQR